MRSGGFRRDRRHEAAVSDRTHGGRAGKFKDRIVSGRRGRSDGGDPRADIFAGAGRAASEKGRI